MRLKFMNDSRGNLSGNGRIYGLDILRAFAILFVIYSHSFFLIIDHVNEKVYNLISLDGVTLFFVLSGFLIGGILLKTIETTSFGFQDLLRFWIRRWFRTLPNYFFMLLLLLLLAALLNKQGPESPLSYFLFLQNFVQPHPGFFPEAWSLSVEEWFYFLVPVILFINLSFSRKNRKRTLLLWIIAIILLVTALRIYRAISLDMPDFESWDQLQRKLVITRLDSIMFGFLGAWLSYYYKEAWQRWKRPLLISGLILLFIPVMLGSIFCRNLFYLQYFSLSVTSFATLILLPALSGLRQGRGKIYRFLSFVSVISYSMYLVNFSLVQLTIIPSLTTAITSITHNHLVISLIRYILYWVLTFLLSYLLYRYWEMPMMKLRERFGKR